MNLTATHHHYALALSDNRIRTYSCIVSQCIQEALGHHDISVVGESVLDYTTHDLYRLDSAGRELQRRYDLNLPLVLPITFELTPISRRATTPSTPSTPTT